MGLGQCPHCGAPLFKANANESKLKAKTSVLVLHKSGRVEINCSSCRNGVVLPLKLVPGQLEKGSVAPRLMVRR